MTSSGLRVDRFEQNISFRDDVMSFWNGVQYFGEGGKAMTGPEKAE